MQFVLCLFTNTSLKLQRLRATQYSVEIIGRNKLKLKTDARCEPMRKALRALFRISTKISGKFEISTIVGNHGKIAIAYLPVLMHIHAHRIFAFAALKYQICACMMYLLKYKSM